MLGRANTRHFSLDESGCNDIRAFYLALIALADDWDRLHMQWVRLFNAFPMGHYVSIRAKEWYQPSDSNNPEYIGDAEDILRGIDGARCRHLKGKPSPEDRYEGRWRNFTEASELRTYAETMIQGLSK